MPTSTNPIYRWAFTWNSHDRILNFNENHIIGTLKKYSDEFAFGLEKGLGTERLHFQGRLKLREKTRNLGKLLEGQMWGIYCTPEQHEEASKQYCMKPETRVAGPWVEPYQYMGEDIEAELRPWQQTIVNNCSTNADKRTINWVYDPDGGIGKSSVVKYLCFHHKAIMMTYGNNRNLIHTVADTKASIYLFDMPKTKPTTQSDNDIYNCMENIKNGCVLDTMYKGGMVMFRPPHVWVFSNWLPDFKKMSLDRWKVWKVIDMTLVETSHNF